MIIDKPESLPVQFKEGFRGIMLLHRNKDGNGGNAQRKSIKKISRNEDEWIKIVLEFRELQETTHPDHRIYSSVNERNINKAIYEFKRRQLDMDMGNLYEWQSFYVDVQNRFFSCLMNPSSKATSYFLIDCDTETEYEHAILQLKDTDLIVFDYPTKNGRHLITKPFNRNDYEAMNIKIDDLLYIG